MFSFPLLNIQVQPFPSLYLLCPQIYKESALTFVGQLEQISCTDTNYCYPKKLSLNSNCDTVLVLSIGHALPLGFSGLSVLPVKLIYDLKRIYVI